MKSSTPWFRHDANASIDGNMLELKQKFGIAGIGAYWMTIEYLYQNDGYLSESAVKEIAKINGYPDGFLMGTHKLGLLCIKDGKVFSQRLLQELMNKEEKSKNGRRHALKRWRADAKKKGMGTHRVPNANPMRGEERRGDKNISLASDDATAKKAIPKHLIPLAVFTLAKGIKFDNAEQLSGHVKRFIRVSTSLKGYSPEQILRAFFHAVDQAQGKHDVQLETVGKKIAMYKDQPIDDRFQPAFREIIAEFTSHKDTVLSSSSHLICTI